MAARSDDFNRSDATLNGATPSDGGSAWSSDTAVWVKSNQIGANSTIGGRFWAALETSASNGTVQHTVRTLAAATAFGVLLRWADTNNFIGAYAYTGKLELYKRVAGTFTQIGSTYTGTISSGDVISLEATSGNALTLKQNGTTRCSGTDSAGSSNTKIGYDWFGADASLRGDDLSWTDASGALYVFNPISGFGGAAAQPL